MLFFLLNDHVQGPFLSNVTTAKQMISTTSAELEQKNRELRNLRDLVKRLFVLLSANSDMDMHLDSQIDELFREWVERQEAKKRNQSHASS